MSRRQVPSDFLRELGLQTERLGPLPLVNHFLDRIGLEDRLDRFVPTRDRRTRLPYARAIAVLVRSILVEREAIYRQQETVSSYAPEVFGLDATLVTRLSDDAIGRALDRLFDADRGTLLTDIVVAVTKEFDIALDEMHNDSTTVRFCGQYRSARGGTIRGKSSPFITYGYSKDHRPDLKQLLFILTASSDGGVPLQFRCEAGNTNDDVTHVQTWETLCRVAGRTDFLYVADSKLCSRDAMNHIAENSGRFLCVMPRSRKEDEEFREWIQTHTPSWELVWDRKHPRYADGPRDRWWTFRYPIPSRENWPVVWVYSSLLKLHQEQRRRERLSRAIQELEALNAKLAGPRPRKKLRRDVQESLDAILRKNKVVRYLPVNLRRVQKHQFRQDRPGRPGPDTRYVRKTRRYWQLSWQIDEDKVEHDRKSDGMYPLITNDRDLSDRDALEAHKRQPALEKRFEQTKTVFEIAPVFLKNPGRIEALFFVYFLVLLVQALIERELRRAMAKAGIDQLPLYPEARACRRPTAEQILRLFSLAQRHALRYDGVNVRVFEPELTDLQKQVLRLLGMPAKAYRHGA